MWTTNMHRLSSRGMKGTFSGVSMAGDVSVGVRQLRVAPDAHVLHQREQVLHALRLVQLEGRCRPQLALLLRLCVSPRVVSDVAD